MATSWQISGVTACAVVLLVSGCSDDSLFSKTGGGTTPTGGSTASGGNGTGAGGTHAGGSNQGGGGGSSGCVDPLADCDGNAGNGCETDTDTDLEHCGGCDNLCSDVHATPDCSGGTCTLTCEAPWDDCDGDAATGCETDTSSSTEHCGGCEQACGGECEFGDCIEPCDGSVALDEEDPTTVLQAIGLCDGVQAAAWVLSDGSAPTQQLDNFHLGHGVVDDFGPNVNPQEGTQMLVLSSGTARRPSDSGYQGPGGFSKQYQSPHPAGFPKVSPSCPGVDTGQPHDAAGIEFTVMAPPGAGGFSFSSKYYTFEWHQYVCSAYADMFVALLSPAGSIADGLVVFDSLGNTIGAHTELIDVCDCQGGPPCQGGGLQFDCTLGTDELQNTGFEEHGATGWLETRVPVEADATITLRLVTYDSGDGVLDSTTLIDNWHWIESPGADPETTVVVSPK